MPQLPPCSTGTPVKSRSGSISRVAEIYTEGSILNGAACGKGYRERSMKDLGLVISEAESDLAPYKR